MSTNDERREVARRLRDEAAHGEMHIRDFLGALCACVKTERNAYCALLLLADMIEPNQDKNGTCPDNVLKASGIDRDALLSLADEMESEGLEGWASGPVNVGLFARRIREAVGA